MDGNLDRWIGVAQPDFDIDIALVLANPNLQRGNEDIVTAHECAHLLGVEHTDPERHPGDLMDPSTPNGDVPLVMDPSYYGGLAEGQPVDVWPSLYMAGSSQIDAAIDAEYRAFGREEFGALLTGVKPITAGVAGQPRYMQEFESGLIGHIEGVGTFSVIGQYFGAWNFAEFGLPTSNQHVEGTEVIQTFELATLARPATAKEISDSQELTTPTMAPPS